MTKSDGLSSIGTLFGSSDIKDLMGTLNVLMDKIIGIVFILT